MFRAKKLERFHVTTRSFFDKLLWNNICRSGCRVSKELKMALKMKLNDPARAHKYFEDKMDFTTGPAELQHLKELNADLNIIDVRAEDDFALEHIPGAKSLAQDKWSTFEGLKTDRVNVLYCYSQVCHLAAQAALKFSAKGYPVMELEGGFQAWKDQELETETLKSPNLILDDKPLNKLEIL